MPTIAEKRAAYRKLHESGCFVIPNPWDVGSARYLQGLGFKALASTSSGYAFTQGLPDGAVTRATMLAHLTELAAATDVPLNADFEGGYAEAPEGVAESVRLCIDTGVAGLSIEDSTGDPAKPLYDFDLTLARVRAARAAIGQSGVVFTARSEGFICGRPDLEETIRRLKAFVEAGADCLYAPGIKTREEIAAVVKAVAPKPVNFLMSSATSFSSSSIRSRPQISMSRRSPFRRSTPRGSNGACANAASRSSISPASSPMAASLRRCATRMYASSIAR